MNTDTCERLSHRATMCAKDVMTYRAMSRDKSPHIMESERQGAWKAALRAEEFTAKYAGLLVRYLTDNHRS
jgi:hypothetical protein